MSWGLSVGSDYSRKGGRGWNVGRGERGRNFLVIHSEQEELKVRRQR